MDGEKVLFAVAVARAEGLRHLPGALTAARAMRDWGEAAGYRTLLVDDAKEPVTIARLREKFQPVLDQNELLIDHLIFHFAGHGFSRGSDDQYLLLSNWRSDDGEAIIVRPLIREVSRFDVRRLSGIIDACSSFDTEKTKDVRGRPLFMAGPFPDNRARNTFFRASIHGRNAYMLRGSASEDAICLYSAVVLQALAGVEPAEGAATRKAVRRGDITEHLDANFETIAARYGLKQDSEWVTNFRERDDVYTTLPIAFTPPSLPEPKAAIAQSEHDIAAELAAEPPRHRVETTLEQVATSIEATIQTHGPLARGEGGLRVVARQVGRAIDRVTDMADWWGRRQRLRARVEAALRPAPRQSTSRARALMALVGGETFQAIAEAPGVWTLRAADTPAPRFVQQGGAVKAIGLSGGRVVPVQPLPGCATNAYLDTASEGGGALALDWRPAGRTDAETEAAMAFLVALADDRLAFGQGAGAPETTLATMGTAALVARQPMAAVIRAYVADAAGDHHAVRALADAFRAARGVVPFDLALLADIRDPALVAGSFPLLPAGWQLLPFARLPVHPALAGLAAGLVPAYPFATLGGEAAERFLALVRAREI